MDAATKQHFEGLQEHYQESTDHRVEFIARRPYTFGDHTNDLLVLASFALLFGATCIAAKNGGMVLGGQ